MSVIKQQFRWGDADEEDEGAESILPPPEVIGPDEKGIKIVIEWRINEDGKKVKVTKKIKVKRVLKKLKPEVVRRRQLKKFGDAHNQLGTDNFTMISTEEIVLERPDKGGKAEEAPKTVDVGAVNPNASLIYCRYCNKKGDHWTTRCPYKDIAASKGFIMGEKAPDDESPSTAAPTSSSAKAYVPPSLRGGGQRGEGDNPKQRGRDENSIRVTNLSEDTREADLQELFGPFGPISRTYVAFNKETGESRGFAFINFVHREDALKAIKKLDGYGYDNLILRVEWATPRADR